MNIRSDIEIARTAKKQPILNISKKLGIPENDIIPYGYDKAKISSNFIEKSKSNKRGKLILVTAINPTPAGEGKTTTTVGLGDGLNKIGHQTTVCIREASLGPCFGMKGGAAGGGYAQVIPMEDMNLHFTGDFHAITSAHNLLSAMIDNHIYWGNNENIDPRRVTWRRVIDMNDRSLRNIVTSLGGISNGYPRESSFDIVAASEVMAILCLSKSFEDLKQRLGNIIIGYRYDKSPVFSKDINANEAMSVLLKEAILPNLVQTLENNPVFVHGGPFANIAHGCNSIYATMTALHNSDFVVTEAGFGADLGAEKFLNIKCRQANLKPDCIVIVATIRALKMNGGIKKENLSNENTAAVIDGCENIKRHIENIKSFGITPIVAINHFSGDSKQEISAIIDFVNILGTEAILCKHWANGSEGTKNLAHKVVEICNKSNKQFKFLYEDSDELIDKIKKITKNIYRADDILIDEKIINQLNQWQNSGFGKLPICMAKTQYSFSADPKLLGAPIGFKVPIKEVRLLSGAGFIVVVCGDIMTMPGLPRKPAAEDILVNNNGEIEGLF